jgi:hypothetical protein
LANFLVKAAGTMWHALFLHELAALACVDASHRWAADSTIQRKVFAEF